MRVLVPARASILALVVATCGATPATAPAAVPDPLPSPAPVPAWITDLGGRIVFGRESGDPTTFTVLRMAADGTGLTPVGAPTTASRSLVTWGPHGRLLFESDRDGTMQVFDMDDGGGEVRQLTMGPELHGNPAISPDGSTMAFGTWTETRDLGIHLAAADGSDTQPRTLTTPPDRTMSGDAQPAFSPDGRLLAFQRVLDASEEKAVKAAIFVIGLDGTGLRQLTPASMDAGHPRWSPDGRTILFHDNADMQEPTLGQSANLWTMAADGSDLRQLTHEAGGNYAIEGTWAPDGSAIAFASWSGEDEFTAIRVMHADGTDATPVWTGTFAGGSGNDPEWSAGS